MDTRELIAKELEKAALGSSDELDAARRAMLKLPHGPARRAQALKVAALAAEHHRCLSALFATDLPKTKR